DDLTKRLSEYLEIDYTEAEKLKIEPGDKKDQLCILLDPVLNNLASEIRVSLDFFEARNNRAVDTIFLTGGSSRLEGVDTYLNHLLGVSIKKLEYAHRLKFEEGTSQEEFKKTSDLYSIALGLALR
ncbi:MAG TPA: pilus assembly protein PilM, partial [Candidatus Omnitrophota bacterium]|nr:pilus assembly protein PilM [Candidatus Omnitrophota bacterium]